MLPGKFFSPADQDCGSWIPVTTCWNRLLVPAAWRHTVNPAAGWDPAHLEQPSLPLKQVKRGYWMRRHPRWALETPPTETLSSSCKIRQTLLEINMFSFPRWGNTFMQYLSTSQNSKKINLNLTIPLTFGCIAQIQSGNVTAFFFAFDHEMVNPQCIHQKVHVLTAAPPTQRDVVLNPCFPHGAW